LKKRAWTKYHNLAYSREEKKKAQLETSCARYEELTVSAS
jgi:hypothetical protein